MAMNHYELLGIPMTASTEEVRRAFRKLSRVHHPDLGGDETAYKRLNAAYHVLSTASERIAYDKSLREESERPQVDNPAPRPAPRPTPKSPSVPSSAEPTHDEVYIDRMGELRSKILAKKLMSADRSPHLWALIITGILVFGIYIENEGIMSSSLVGFLITLGISYIASHNSSKLITVMLVSAIGIILSAVFMNVGAFLPLAPSAQIMMPLAGAYVGASLGVMMRVRNFYSERNRVSRPLKSFLQSDHVYKSLDFSPLSAVLFNNYEMRNVISYASIRPHDAGKVLRIPYIRVGNHYFVHVRFAPFAHVSGSTSELIDMLKLIETELETSQVYVIIETGFNKEVHVNSVLPEMKKLLESHKHIGVVNTANDWFDRVSNHIEQITKRASSHDAIRFMRENAC